MKKKEFSPRLNLRKVQIASLKNVNGGNNTGSELVCDTNECPTNIEKCTLTETDCYTTRAGDESENCVNHTNISCVSCGQATCGGFNSAGC